ncbi:MAG: spherulation-specific family 4 protein, partial [Thermomicrobiales bacterium]|nr:spherulation-specific family 4 protein [Thermomicrobiales bacterium]
MDQRFAQLRLGRRAFAASAGVLLGRFASLMGGAPAAETAQAAQCPAIFVPAYFDDDAAWRQMTETRAVRIVIINLKNGPGPQRSAVAAQRVRDVQASGALALGYVPTSRGKRPAKQVRAEIRKFRQWYAVDGIYVDEVSGKSNYLKYYRALSKTIRKGPAGKRFVMFNPGFTPDRRYMALADVIENYEYFFHYYPKQVFPPWVRQYPATRFAHVVHDVPSTSDALEWVLANARANNAGYVFVTDRNNP